MADLPIWKPLPGYDADAVNLDFDSREPEPYVPPYTAPPGDAVALDFWGDYDPDQPLDLRLDFRATVYRYVPPAANAVDLNFEGVYAPPTAGNVSLDFGGSGDQEPEQRLELTIDATLSTLTASVRVRQDTNVYREPSALAGDRYQHAARTHHQTRQAYSQSSRQHARTASRYQHAAPLGVAVRHRNQGLDRRQPRVRVHQQYGAPLATQQAVSNRRLPRLDSWRWVRQQPGALHAQHAGVLNHFLPHVRTQWGLPYEQASALLSRHWGDRWQFGEFRPLGLGAPYEQAEWPGPGTSPVTPWEPRPPIDWPDYPGPGQPDPDPPRSWCQYRGGTTLDISGQVPVWPNLDFDTPGVCVDLDAPIQRTYLVSNSASLTLVATGQALDASAISVAIDADSWAWELRATLVGETSIAAVRDAAQPCELEATLNGHTWRVVLDSWGRDRQFGGMATITLGARSLAAYLGAPHAAPRNYVETNDRTAQQLAEQELPLGWTLDWQIDDWLVDAEAWHYTSRTPIEAITAIAEAAGGVVQAHPSEPRLIVAPRYRAPHWAWDGETPDVTLPLDVLTRLGSDYRPTEALNGVYVSGETTGVLALVKRTGTAADRLGEMVVDPLVTRQAAARGRGIAVLSASGDQSRESLQLPVSADIAGLLATGQLVRVDPTGDDWRGLVRAVSIAAGVDGDGALTINQTAEVERHLEETA